VFLPFIFIKMKKKKTPGPENKLGPYHLVDGLCGCTLKVIHPPPTPKSVWNFAFQAEPYLLFFRAIKKKKKPSGLKLRLLEPRSP